MLSAVSCTEHQQTEADKAAARAKQEAKNAAAKAQAITKNAGDDIKEGAGKLKDKADEMTDTTSSKSSGAGHAAKTGAQNMALTAKVKSALANSVGLKTVTHVKVTTEGSTVTLTGTVPSALDMQRAEKTVNQVSGVTAVVNDLRVATASEGS